MNNLTLLKTTLLFFLLLLIGCKKDKKEEIFSDPEGAIETVISRDDYVLFEGERSSWRLQWTYPNNFHLRKMSAHEDHVSIYEAGAISGLGAIREIPVQNYFSYPGILNDSVTCEVGHGYIFKLDGRFYWRTYYVRLFVEEAIVSHTGIIIGAKIKYQFPFVVGEYGE